MNSEEDVMQSTRFKELIVRKPYSHSTHLKNIWRYITMF